MSNIINLQRFNITTFNSSPKYFYDYVKDIPILTKEQECELVSDMNVKECLEAAHKLVIHNLRYVHSITHKYSGYNLPYEDLVQEGVIGLMKAIKNFDMTFGVGLCTHAKYYIESAIKEYIVNNWNIIKITSTPENRKLFFNIRKHIQNPMNPTKLEIEDASLKLGIKEKEIRDFSQRLHNGECSIDEPVTYDNGDGHTDLILADIMTDDVTIEDQLLSLENDKVLDAVHEALCELNQREKDIIASRYLIDNKTLTDLSKIYGISTERVRQIEKNAITKIKKTLSSTGVV